MNLPILNLPTFQLKMRMEQGKEKIFDPIRHKWLVLTPEEWVRQNMTAFLLEHKQVPPIRIVNEVAMQLNGLQRRCDGIIYDNQCRPLVMIEYKASHIAINQKVFDQIAVYNTKFNVPFLLVSNGMQHIFCSIDVKNQAYRFFKDIPSYNDLINLL